MPTAVTAEPAAALADAALVCEAAPADPPNRTEHARRSRILATDATARGADALADDAVGGQTRLQPDDLMAGTLAEKLIDLLGLEPTADVRIALFTALASGARNLEPAHPECRSDPGDTLTRLLRDAMGYSGDGIPALDEARRLAEFAVAGVMETMGVPTDGLRDVLKNAGRPLVAEDDADEADPLLGLLGDDLWDAPDEEDEAAIVGDEQPPAADDAVQQQASVPLPAVTLALLGAVGVKRLRRLMRFAIPPGMTRRLREYARAHANAPRHTAADGLVVEDAIRAAYATTVGANRAILFGTRAGGVTLGDVASQNPVWAAVKAGLLSFLSGRVGAPDILDVDLGHVYEIKPKRSAVAAARQLYWRYLFWLNLAEVGAANGHLSPLKVAAWAARICRGNPAPPPLVANGPFTPPQRVWTPGPWQPPSLMILPGRIVEIEVPVPGVIVYQVLGGDKKPQTAEAAAPDKEAFMKYLVAVLLAWILVRANEQTGRAAPPETARWVDDQFVMPPSSVDGTVVVVVVVAIAVIALAIFTAPIWVPAVTIKAGVVFGVGGAAALVGAT